MFIQTEETPNPATLKFLPGRIVMESGTANFPTAESAHRSPLAERVFGIEGVTGVFLGSDFVTVTKDADLEWHVLKPAILGVSIAACRLLESRGLRPDFVAGHSLGEYSANVAAGTMNFADAARIVRRRGRYMQEAVPVGTGAMAAVIGLDIAVVEQACAEAAQGEVVSPANLNGGGQVVIAGATAASTSAPGSSWSRRSIPTPTRAIATTSTDLPGSC